MVWIVKRLDLTNKIEWKSLYIRTLCDSCSNWSDDKLFNSWRARGVASVWGCTTRLAMRKMCMVYKFICFQVHSTLDTQDKQTLVSLRWYCEPNGAEHVTRLHLKGFWRIAHSYSCLFPYFTHHQWAIACILVKFRFQFHPWHCRMNHHCRSNSKLSD